VNLPRELVLKELGVAPVWRLKAAQPAAASPAASGRETGEHRMHILQMDWAQLKEAVANCTACDLYKTRTQAVFGVGDEQAEWLIIGEAPGADEDAQGEPFVGQAGKLLDNMLAAIGLRRGEDVYIANAVKCRPPANRTPEAEEIAACRPYLQRQIALLRPKLIVALGRPAAQALLQSEVKISAARGRLHALNGIPVIVTYHPAYLLRNLPDKAKAWEDLCLMRRTMRELKAHA
jgi:DNA polymerase